MVANLGLSGDGPQSSNFGRDAADLAAVLRAAGFQDVQVVERTMESVLEGGVPQALKVARATSASAAMVEASAEQQTAIDAAIAAALEPSVRPDGVHLTSVANVASAHV